MPPNLQAPEILLILMSVAFIAAVVALVVLVRRNAKAGKQHRQS